MLQLLLVVGVLEFDVQVLLVVATFLVVYAWVVTVSSTGHRHGTLPRSVTRFGLLLGASVPGGPDHRRGRTAVPLGIGDPTRVRVPGAVIAAVGWLALPVWPLLAGPPGVQQGLIAHLQRGRNVMRTAYKVLAYLVAAEVAIQAMVMVWAIAGLAKWVDGGGVFDKSVIESQGTPFPRLPASSCMASTGPSWSQGSR